MTKSKFQIKLKIQNPKHFDIWALDLIWHLSFDI